MILLVALLLLLSGASSFAEESIIYDDGTGAQISYYLPAQVIQDGRHVEYKNFNIHVVKDNKFLLLAILTGSITKSGKYFFGTVIIPSSFIDSAEIILLGSPPNSGLGVSKTIQLRTLRRIHRNKSWTDQ